MSNNLNEVQEKLFNMLGEVSSLFMSQETKGTEIVMPTEELEEIGLRFLAEVQAYGEAVRADEIQEADNRLKNEFAEDWLEFRDTRLQELTNVRVS